MKVACVPYIPHLLSPPATHLKLLRARGEGIWAVGDRSPLSSTRQGHNPQGAGALGRWSNAASFDRGAGRGGSKAMRNGMCPQAFPLTAGTRLPARERGALLRGMQQWRGMGEAEARP